MSDTRFTYAFVATLFSISITQIVGRLVKLNFSEWAPIRVTGDFEHVWHPFAVNVLQGAQPYVPPAGTWDNKPPVFHVVNVATAATGYHHVSFELVIGLANAAAAVFLWRYCKSRGRSGVGVVAALLYLGALPAVGGLWVNPRQISIMLVLLALLVEGPIRRGALISLAALFSQWFVLASIPITLFSLHDRSPRERLRWLAKFGITGLTLAVGSYLAVFVLYGESSLRHAVRYSVLMEYPRPHPSVFNQQIRLIGGHIAHSRGILAILLLAGYGAYDRLVSSDGVSIDGLLFESIAMAAVFFVPFGFRPGLIYWLPVLPFASILAVSGISAVLGKEWSSVA